jgi:hypothetical protein
MPPSALHVFRSLTQIKAFFHNPKETLRVWRHECIACGGALEKAADGTEYCNVINCETSIARPITAQVKPRSKRVHPDDKLEFLHDIGRHQRCAHCGAYSWDRCQTVGCALWGSARIGGGSSSITPSQGLKTGSTACASASTNAATVKRKPVANSNGLYPDGIFGSTRMPSFPQANVSASYTALQGERKRHAVRPHAS